MAKKLGKWWKKQFQYGEKGFTLIELLVVVAILGILAVVAVPNVGKFINKGKAEAKAAELHNVQTAAMALLTESTTGYLSANYTGVADMDNVLAPGASGPISLSSFMTGLDGNGLVQSGVTYDITWLATVTQN